MTRTVLVGIVLTGALFAPTADSARVSCSRDGLQRAVDLYIAAQTKGDTSGLPLATGLGYVENHAAADINTGLIKMAMKIDHHRSLIDAATCQTFTEAIVTNKESPYVLGTRLRVNHDRIAEIEILWTTTGYWSLNADNYLKYHDDGKVGRRSRQPARYESDARRGCECLSGRVSRREERPGPVGLSLQSHGGRDAHGQ